MYECSDSRWYEHISQISDHGPHIRQNATSFGAHDVPPNGNLQ